jgi:NAD(P)-dependent dehydrogenase (short-subunit alcohol dehydrogenase family)
LQVGCAIETWATSPVPKKLFSRAKVRSMNWSTMTKWPGGRSSRREPHGRQRQDVGDAAALQRVDVGAVVDRGRRMAVAAAVAGHEHDGGVSFPSGKGERSMGRLEGKITIVTGATSGIGRRTVELFVAEGAKVVATGRREELGRTLEASLGKDNCLFVTADARREDDVKRMFDACLSRWGRVDCLFNNAGGPAPVGGIETVPVEGFDAAMATLVRSVMLGMKHAAPLMMAQGSGSIINNGSVAGRRAGYSTSMIYGAAKAAVNHLTVCVAMQLGEKNVRVNSISPGGIATGIFAKALGLPPDKADSYAEAMKASMAKNQPIPRAGIVDDIAKAAVFLASDDSTFINGHDLVVDGGLVGGRLWTPHQEGVKAMRQAFGVDEI